MLKLVNTFNDISIGVSSPYLAKIQALYLTYGNNFNFAKFWHQGNDTVVSCVDGNVTLFCTVKTDYTELAEFINFIGASSVSCDYDDCEKLSIIPDDSSFIVKYTGEPFNSELRVSDNYRAIYKLLNECEFELGTYESFLSDFALRVNKGVSLITVDDYSVLSTASALFIGLSDVLLGAVATSPKARGMGKAALLVKSLSSHFSYEGKNVFLFCRENSLAEFYKKCGFSVVGRWSQTSFR